MIQNSLTVKRLEGYLRLKEYRIPEIKLTSQDINEENFKKMEQANRIMGRNFHHAFEIWYKQFKRIPTPQEFLVLQLQDLKNNMKNPSWRAKNYANFEFTPAVEKGIKHRILRSYKSFIIELHTVLAVQEIFPDLKVITNAELDFAGVDLLVKDHKNKIEHSIHITKASEYAIDFLFKKEGRSLTFRGYGSKLYARPKWTNINHCIYKHRDFTGHTFLLYYTQGQYEIMQYINGYPLFRMEYIKYKLDVNTAIKCRHREGLANV